MGVAFVPVFLLGQCFERVLWWWAWQGPLECICVLVPVVVLCHALACEQRVEHDADKQQEGCEGEKSAPRRDIVPVSEGFRIVDVAAWHALTTQEVLWEEGQVYTDKEHPEVNLTPELGILAP